MQQQPFAANLSPLKQRRKLLERAEEDFAAAAWNREVALKKNSTLKTLDHGLSRLIYFTGLANQRKTHATHFSKVLNDLAKHLLANTAIAEEFFAGLDALRQAGINLMRKRYGDGTIYHQVYHAIQVSYDSMRETERMLGPTKTQQDWMLHLIMIGLAGAAAAWHDDVQGKKVKTYNEIASADEFCDQLMEMLNNNDVFIAEFLKYRELIAEELIVDATFLDYQKDNDGHISAMPVGLRIDAEFTRNSEESWNPFQLLLVAKRSIALVDASSASAKHVQEEQVILHSLPKDDRSAIQQFLTSGEMKNVSINPETFLQSIGQSMRMLLESANKPKGKDYVQYEQAILTNRPDATVKNESAFSYCNALKHFLHEKVLEAEDKFSIYMSNGDTDSVWQEQRACLSALQKYMQRITPEKLEKLAKALFVSVAHERGTNEIIQSAVMSSTLMNMYSHPDQVIPVFPA